VAIKEGLGYRHEALGYETEACEVSLKGKMTEDYLNEFDGKKFERKCNWNGGSERGGIDRRV